MGSKEKLPAHRPGLFKLPPKRHKTGPHRSKSAVTRATAGKIDLKSQTIKKKGGNLSRTERKNRLQQIRAHKQEQSLAHGLTGPNRVPFLTAVISFDPHFSSDAVIDKLVVNSDSSVSKSTREDITYITVDRFKSRYAFVNPSCESVDDILNCLKVSDVLLLVWPLVEEISEEQELLLSTILAHGIPSTLHVVSKLPANGKQRDQARKIIDKSMERWAVSDKKVLNLDTASDAMQILRYINSVRKEPTILQKRRPHMLIENIQVAAENSDKTCTLQVSGYLRGPPLNVNKLVHITGWGDFQLSRIESGHDPRSMRVSKDEMSDLTVVKSDPEKQTPLNPEVIPDPFDLEQQLELESTEDGNMKFTAPKITKKVPKGTSDYQAAWIDDESGEDDLSGTDEDEEDEEDEQESQFEAHENPDEFGKEESMSYVEGRGDLESRMSCSADENQEIDMSEVEKYRLERENAQWPDEVETPHGVPARERFQKYRGLKSFRTSHWDAKENLPFDYGRIYKFLNFKHTKKITLASAEKYSAEKSDECVEGGYVTLSVINAPMEIYEEWLSQKSKPMLVYGLLTHEHKMSLLNLVLRKHPSCNVPIKSKQSLIFHVGYRRFEAEAVLSQHTNGNKFKMERFMPAEGTSFCASLFAPIIFPPATVLVYRRDQKGKQHLVATGTVLDLNPDRIILKRVVLSGHPSKVNKRSVVVRYMFFNKEDIEWFKPVELYTPRGRRGHIKESLGTHGLLKAVFDQPLGSQDSVMLNLYKRVFPKWTFNSRIKAPVIEPSSQMSTKDQEEAMEE